MLERKRSSPHPASAFVATSACIAILDLKIKKKKIENAIYE